MTNGSQGPGAARAAMVRLVELRRRPRATNSAKLLWLHRRLLWRLTWAELAARYAGSILGRGWVFGFPLLILGVYAIVYALILRLGVYGFSPAEYVLYMSAGLTPFLMTAEALSLGVTSVVANRAILTNTVFPVDLLPAKAVLLSQATMVSGLVVVTLSSAALGRLRWTALLAPVLWGLLLLALVGTAWILSLVNIVFRDLQTLINGILMLLLVASPIAYTPEMVPRGLRPLVALNPLAYFIVAYQRVLVLGVMPGAMDLVLLALISVGLFIAGGWIFVRAKTVMIDYV